VVARRIAASASSAVFLGLLIVIAVGAGFLAVSAPKSPHDESTTQAVSTQTTTALSPTSSSSTSIGPTANESVGTPELLVSANATIQEGQNLSIIIAVVNPSPSSLIVGASDDWSVNGFPVAMWGGCSGLEPVEFMIVKGNYTLEGLQAASANASIPQGGCEEGGSVGVLLFQGEGSGADVKGTFCEASCFPDLNHFDLDSNFTVSGFWAYPINASEAADVFTPPHPECFVSGRQDCSTYNYPEVGPFAQHTFVPGWYTLAVSDEWGQAVLRSFEVVGSTP
jgi:hypothetical protein